MIMHVHVCVHACMRAYACVCACVRVCLLMLQPGTEDRKIAAKSAFREIIKMTGTVPERVEKPKVLIEMSSNKDDELIDAIAVAAQGTMDQITAGLNPCRVEGILSGECRQHIMADFGLDDKDFDAVYSWIIDGDPDDEPEDQPEDPDDLEVGSAKGSRQ